MARATFAATVRTVECPNCSAPLETPLAGGQFKCTYCNAVAMVTRRRADAHAGPGRAATTPTAGVDRLSRLKAQVDHPVHGHAYDLERIPPGLEHATLPNVPAFLALQKEWNLMKAAAGPPPSLEEQLRICWVAVMLAGAYRRQREPLRTRAVLETALDRLADDGHRHIIRCRLAREAVEAGDADAARAWLDECDSTPEVLELDGEYRLAAARAHLARHDSVGALRLLGAERGTIPVDPPHELAFAELRIAAHEQSGQLQIAEAELEAASFKHGVAAVRERLKASGLAPRTLRLRIDRKQRQEEQRRAQAQQHAAHTKRAARRAGCILLTVVLAGIGAIVGGQYLWATYRPFPMSCGHNGEIVIEGRTETSNVDLISAPYGCTIVIRDSKLRGRKVVVAGYNTTIKVERSTLTGKNGVIEAGYDSTIRIRKKSTIVNRGGADDAITIGWGGVVDIRDSTIESAGQILDAGYNAKITVSKAKLKVTANPEYALTAQWQAKAVLTSSLLQTRGGGLKLGYRSELDLKSSTIVTGADGDWLLDSGYGTQLRVERSRLESGSGGVRSEHNAQVHLLSGSSLTVAGNGVETKHGSRVHMSGAKLKAGQVGIAMKANAKVALKKKSSLDAGITGVTADYRLAMEIRDSSVKAGHTAVVASWDAVLRGQGARLEGKQRSVALGRNALVTLPNSKLVGRQEIEQR